MRIGISAVHLIRYTKGILFLAESALKELKLDRIFFVPAKKSPLKNHPLFKRRSPSEKTENLP